MPALSVDIPQVASSILMWHCNRRICFWPAVKAEILQGTLDLMVLKTLEAMGPLHGYGIARRIEQISEDMLRLNQGTIYAALLRLVQKGWIKAEWGASENNRKARFYSLLVRAASSSRARPKAGSSSRA